MVTESRGQSLVEFALVIPVFLLILGGVIQLGFILWGANTLNQVVRDTGRYAATLNCSAAAEIDAENQFDTLLADAGGPWTSPTKDVTYSSSTCPEDNADVVWVEVTASANAPILFPFVPGNGAIGASTTFRVEPQP